jgi:hypothetical protein
MLVGKILIDHYFLKKWFTLVKNWNMLCQSFVTIQQNRLSLCWCINFQKLWSFKGYNFFSELEMFIFLSYCFLKEGIGCLSWISFWKVPFIQEKICIMLLCTFSRMCCLIEGRLIYKNFRKFYSNNYMTVVST